VGAENSHPEGSNNAIVALTSQDPSGEPARPWRSAFSTVSSAASSSPCHSTAWTPSPKTRRSWCSVIKLAVLCRQVARPRFSWSDYL